MSCRLCVWKLVLPLALGSLGLAAAGSESPGDWLTGSRFEKQLAEPVDVFYSGTPLRQAVMSLSRTRRVAALIDRRVDPG